MVEPALALKGLTVEIGGIPIVDRLDLSVQPGEILAIVGESGCGKSLTAFASTRLLPSAARLAAGEIRLGATDLAALSEAEMQQRRGNKISMIFQEPVASLNPLMPVGQQVAESLRIHRGMDAKTAYAAAIEMLTQVGIPDPARRAQQYPFELSGGMCQRIVIASALICRPDVLIADEPTTALDVTVQAQILDLMRRLRAEVGSAIIFITHDMGVVADIADRVCVMYAGRIVETGAVDDLFEAPKHPYTKLLLATIPRLEGDRKTRLRSIKGTIPDSRDWPQGCRFKTRCPIADDQCDDLPPLTGGTHAAACWHQDKVEALV
jgi:peptide/nickel transport system ATP-binding protein